MILNEQKQRHYDCEINTAAIVKYCYHEKCYGNELTPRKLFELCRLTWYDKKLQTKDKRKWNALWIISNNQGECPEVRNIDEFSKYGFSPELISLARNDTGFIGLYRVFRNSSLNWIVENFNSIAPLVHKAAKLEHDATARGILEQIEKMDGIPKPNSKSGRLHSTSLLTPLFACLDPRLRFPIINKNNDVIKLHKKLSISYSSRAEQFDALIQQIGRHGIANALMLDVCSSELADQLKVSSHKNSSKKNPQSRKLNAKNENDVKILIRHETAIAHQLHNKMTNHLQKLCVKSKYDVKQQLYDAIIGNYNKGRDLLIEAKSSMDRPSLRLAVGQLLDYHRNLPRRAVTDMAVLLPRKPDEDALSYLSDIGIYALWFTNADFEGLDGNIVLRFIE